MGARISKEPVEPPANWPPDAVQPYEDPFPVYIVSQSRFYSLVQQASLWGDYFVLHDQRPEDTFRKKHIATAKAKWDASQGLDWAWDVTVLIYSSSHKDPAIQELVDALVSAEYPPAAVYILEGGMSAFLKRYKALSSGSALSDSLPGPVELIPPTPTHVGTYAIHRVHFMRSKNFTSRLNIGTIINISARRLFVKTPGISLENTSFSSSPAPDDFVVVIYCKYANEKLAKKGKKNILIIDEPGCDYATILAGWHLIKYRDIPPDTAIESITMRNGFLDTWYTDVLTEWCS
ncbi:hypothetical protein GNI_059850 [Gregarina niphandrodes]|uniref:Rhodanese domain-containing protein n=1 Tax=Gregarina niphandrodes TaxID=110365 RepID=A0A023B8L0_GRENI|nr:hypothetical protein GNI_059850 [Gregarina niphandrodes]EZG69112.1 hypothetical protein GNI_059850 [Gregarina niphandrodes]|eukprot:XP_011134492.1 hypothetical protein GNI_059850 [Gregarina niphandrodes]